MLKKSTVAKIIRKKISYETQNEVKPEFANTDTWDFAQIESTILAIIELTTSSSLGMAVDSFPVAATSSWHDPWNSTTCNISLQRFAKSRGHHQNRKKFNASGLLRIKIPGNFG